MIPLQKVKDIVDKYNDLEKNYHLGVSIPNCLLKNLKNIQI